MENMKEKMEFKLQAAFINTGKHVHNNNQRGDAPFSVSRFCTIQNTITTDAERSVYKYSNPYFHKIWNSDNFKS